MGRVELPGPCGRRNLQAIESRLHAAQRIKLKLVISYILQPNRAPVAAGLGALSRRDCPLISLETRGC